MEYKNELNKVQKRLLEMGKVIAGILEHNDIPYMVTFGTLLGAVRHGGFIPWDDDFDLFLFDDTYEKAMMVLEKELPSDMFLENSKSEPLYFHSYAHVKDLGTVTSCRLFPQDGLYSHKGLSIDLYKAVPMKESELDKFIIPEHIKYLKKRMQIGSIGKNEFEEKIAMLNDRITNIEPNISDKQIFGMSFPEPGMEVDKVFPLKKIKFEDTEFYAPSDSDSILKGFYGDYMKLPPEKDRIPHYDFVKFLD